MPLPELSAYNVSLFCSVPACLFLVSALSTSWITRPRAPRGCRRLGIKSVSNIADEFECDERGLKKVETDPNSVAQEKGIEIKAVFAYPLKSCAGIEFDTAEFSGTGLRYDRQFCFAEYITPAASASESAEGGTEGRWDCRTLRDGKFSRMTLIRTEIWVPDPSSPTYSPTAPEVRSNGVLVIRYPRVAQGIVAKLLKAFHLVPQYETFQVPLEPSPHDNHPRLTVRVFKSHPTAISYRALLPSSLATFLGTSRPLTLFRSLPTQRRPVRGNSIPLEQSLGFAPDIAFADEYPLQLQNLGSIRAIAAKVGTDAIPKFSVRRFRPNIVVSGCPAFEEDYWKTIRFVHPSKDIKTGQADKMANGTEENSTTVHVCCRTVRCRLPNVDPDTGIRHPVEPDRTLRATRAIDDGAPGGGCLGMMMVPAVTDFTVHVGDRVEVLETGEHFYTKGDNEVRNTA